MSRGIFSLNESYNEQVSGDWSTASDVWAIGSPVTVKESLFGYIAGGDTGSGPFRTIVERIDYSKLVESNKLLIEDYKLQIELKDDMIQVVKPKWYENKYIWFGLGVVFTSGGVYLAGQL